MSGGSGSDTLNLFVNNSSGWFNNNVVSLTGGGGDDNFDINLWNLGGAAGNTVNIWGGVGSDTITIDAATSAAQFIFKYSAVTEPGVNGDNVLGLTAGHNVNFLFNAAAFNGETAGLGLTANGLVFGAPGTAVTQANDYFIYNAATRALWYDADGSGATAAVKVAQFDANVNITSGNISFY